MKGMPTQTNLPIPRPGADEFAPYYGKYIDLVPEGDLISTLEEQLGATVRLVTSGRDKADHAYAPGKWTVKEVLGHLIDGERIFGYRALRFARNDTTDLPGFDENEFVANANFGSRTIDDLLEELRAVRASTVAFARTLPSEAFGRRGNANGKQISVRALLYVTAGHERHHVELLRSRYGLVLVPSASASA
jgi:hypothetical protein